VAVTVELETLRGLMGLGATTPPDGTLQPGIDAAVLLAEEELAACGYSAARLDSIALYLAAHFVEPGVTGGAGTIASESTGRSSVTYSTATLGEDLKGSRWGQIALQLDTKGCLAKLGKRRISVTTFPRACA
jgi:hypothetical protein